MSLGSLLNGDSIITTPLVRHLHEEGNEVYYLTSDSGMKVLANNPHITKLIHHKTDSIPTYKLYEYFKSVAQAYECDKFIDLCESIECHLCFSPWQPQYMYSKEEKLAIANHNYYSSTFEFAGYKVPDDSSKLIPEVFFTDEEERESANFRKDFIGKKIIIWALSGSGLNKTYPYAFLVMSKILLEYPDVVFITVGDDKCKLLETPLKHERVIHKSGKWSFRQSMIACKYASLVISPDTGILHVSGCFKTPKIGLLNHTTIKNITRYFLNDFSLESDFPCSPCFKLIYDSQVVCNLDPDTKAPFCVMLGLNPERVVERIHNVFRYCKN